MRYFLVFRTNTQVAIALAGGLSISRGMAEKRKEKCLIDGGDSVVKELGEFL